MKTTKSTLVKVENDSFKNACPFCEELLKALDNDEYYKKPHEYTVSLISRHYHDGYVCGQLTYGSKSLNFCPVCGKKLNLEKMRKEIQKKYNETK